MTMTPVRSSNVAAIGHDSATNTLRVEFKNGGLYEYKGVTAAQHRALLAAPSIGSHFHKNIRNRFEGTRIS